MRLLSMPKARLVFSRFLYIRGNLGNVKEKSTRKTCFSREMKKWSFWLYTSTLQNFARRHFFDVNGVSIKISWEANAETGEKMWKVLKTKAERKVVPQLAGEILRSTEVKFEVTESKLRLLMKHNVMHVEKHSCE